MKIPFLKSKASKPAGGAALQADLRTAAERFSRWAKERSNGAVDSFRRDDIATVEQLIEAEAAKSSEAAGPELLISDFAAYLGEVVRLEWQGIWVEDELFGIALHNVDGMPGVRLLPLAMAEKKWELREKLSLSDFIESLQQRLDKEREQLPYQVAPHPSRVELAGKLAGSEDATIAANKQARDFIEWWKSRFGAALPLTLQGVRELERFLRSQFFLFALQEATLVQMGFFVGEVARGLFQGAWSFDDIRETNEATRAALAWPELPYYPVGRVFRLVTEQPENETLVEYIQLIPSARSELRKQQASNS